MTTTMTPMSRPGGHTDINEFGRLLWELLAGARCSKV